MQPTQELPAVSHWRSSHPDQVADGLRQAFPDANQLTFRRDGRFHYGQTIASVGPLRLVRYENSGFCFSGTQGADFHLGFVLRGNVAIRSRGSEIITRPFVQGNALKSFEKYTIDVEPGTITHTIDLPHRLLADQAEALFGRAVETTDCGIQMDLRGEAGSALVRNVRSAFNEIVWLENAQLSPLAITSYTELLANLILVTAFPELRAELGESSADAGQIVSRRAKQYLDEFAHEPLRIADLAKTMGVTVRSLQIGFRRQFGCSPLQYLLTRRLELARERLMSPMPGDTITMIATEHGFMNLGKFASRYRARFCELPSETLRRRRSALQA